MSRIFSHGKITKKRKLLQKIFGWSILIAPKD
jgi:hypothetical protein